VRRDGRIPGVAAIATIRYSDLAASVSFLRNNTTRDRDNALIFCNETVTALCTTPCFIVMDA
jgi:hypothetical protein